MKKVIVIIILIVLLSAGAFSLYSALQNKDVKELNETEINLLNKNYYLDTECMADCPVIINESSGNETWEPLCWDNCVQGMIARYNTAKFNFSGVFFGGTVGIDYEENKDYAKEKLLFWASELESCRTNSDTLSEIMSCIKHTLPALKEKYKIEE